MSRRAAWLPAVAALAGLALAAGCEEKAPPERRDGLPQPTVTPEPVERAYGKEAYRVAGKVVDAQTKEPLRNARLRLKVAVPTVLGPRVWSTYGIAGPTGGFELELNLPFATMRTATAIQLAAAAPGYLPQAVKVPPPTEARDVYAVPPVGLVKQAAKPFGPPQPAGDPEPLPPEPPRTSDSPLPWK